MSTPVLDVVIPVHNEQHTVTASVRRLHHHLEQTFPYPFRITVADNASTDATAAVASGLVAEFPEVVLTRLSQKGRGRALKQVWLASEAPILAYMDVDLSTDLDALWPLVAPLMSGHSDVAIGSRLARGARVVRGTKREVISRCYNLVLRASLGARFTDAQCGFKAIRSDVAAELLPLVEDPTWFFDTELLVLAQRTGLRIHEVPVDWFDDPDSRVDVVGTALDDLRGVVRVRRALASGRLPVADVASRIGRHVPGAMGSVGTGGARPTGTWHQLTRFAAVGVASTVVHLGLFAGLAPVLGSTQAANLVALLLATVVNTALNRRWTFGVQGAGMVRHQLQGMSLFTLTWVLTAGALARLHTAVASPSTVVATVVVAMATAASAAVRFAAMRTWMFRSEPASSEPAASRPASSGPATPGLSTP